NPRLTFNDAADQWWERSVLAHRKGNTIPTYASHLAHLRRHFGPDKLSEITVQDVAGYLATLDGASWTRCGRLTVLSAVFNYAARYQGHSGNPCKTLHRDERPKGKTQRRHKILTPDETERLLACASDWDRTLLTLTRQTGLRKGEA